MITYVPQTSEEWEAFVAFVNDSGIGYHELLRLIELFYEVECNDTSKRL